MPFVRKYPIPREVLERVAAKQISCADVGRIYDCAPTTVRSQVKALYRTPAPERSSLIGNKVFGRPRVQPSERFVPTSRPDRQDASLTGCPSALACV